MAKQSPQEKLKELSLLVLDDDLKEIVMKTPQSIMQCLLVQTARRGNQFRNSYLAGAKSIS